MSAPIQSQTTIALRRPTIPVERDVWCVPCADRRGDFLAHVAVRACSRAEAKTLASRHGFSPSLETEPYVVGERGRRYCIDLVDRLVA